MARISHSPEHLKAHEPAILDALLASRAKRKANRLPFEVPYVQLPVFDDAGLPQTDPATGHPLVEPLYFECMPIEGSVIDDCVRKATRGQNTRPNDHELNCRIVLAATTEEYRRKWWQNEAVRAALAVGESWMVIDQLVEPGDVSRAAAEIMQESGYGSGAQLERAKSAGSADRNGRDGQ